MAQGHIKVRMLGVLTGVAGVSGSGKSSLVAQALIEWVAAHLDDSPTRGPLADGSHDLHRRVQVDQKPIGRMPRLNLAIHTGLFEAVRQRFAASPAAIARQWGTGRFSFNVAGGRVGAVRREQIRAQSRKAS